MKRITAVLLVMLMLVAGLQVFTRVQNTIDIPILLYHHIAEGGEGASTIDPDVFRSHLDAIQDAGFHTITFQQLSDFVMNGAELPVKPIMITFDDGYLSNYEIAWHALMERGMTATIFVVGSSVGKSTYKETGVPIIPHFSYEQAWQMVASGVISIQSHTFDMHQLAYLEPDDGRNGVLPKEDETSEEYLNALRTDFQKSINELADYTGEPVIALAYPLGLHTQLSERVCTENGIQISLTTEPRVAQVIKDDSDSLRLLSRLSIDDCTAEELLQIISGERTPNAEYQQNQLAGREIAYGDYSGSSYEASWILHKKEGDIINFYGNNRGTTSVIIMINGESKKVLEPGEQDHISLEVNDFLNLGKWYTVKCLPTVHGADINITYAVAQRDST